MPDQPHQPDELSTPDVAGVHAEVRHRREVEIVLVRHGESQWNAAGRYQGQAGPGLTELGHQQAEAAADFLERSFPAFDRAIASDLPRVQETLQPWRERTGVTPTVDPQWREIDAGAWSGLFPDEVREQFPEQVAAVDRGEDIHRGGGETFAEFRVRTWQAMTATVTQSFDDVPADRPVRMVVFTHGGCITMSAAEALGLPPMGQRWLRGPANCSVSVLRHQIEAGDDGVRRIVASELVDFNVPTS